MLLYHINFGENRYCIIDFNIGFYNRYKNELFLTTIISTFVQTDIECPLKLMLMTYFLVVKT